jgi:hypothetical protein
MTNGRTIFICECCKFWERVESFDAKGECHRRAPIVSQQFALPQTTWPLTLHDDYCGDFVKRSQSDRR